jgi:acyl-coenzyme A thioesterase PaaI-like protein
VLTVEYKVNLLAPAVGTHLIARGRVTRPGRTIVVCSGDVQAVREGEEHLVAVMLATMMVVRDRGNVVD